MNRLSRFVLSNRIAFAIVGVYVLAQAVLLFTYPQSNRPSYAQVIAWDTFGYYLYLPSAFIYHDLFGLKFIPALMQQYFLSSYFYQAHIGPAGTYVMDYPGGMSILYSPFFFMGHIVAKILGYRADGFSPPYMYSVFIGGIFYALAGITFTIRNLRSFFNEKITAVLILVLLFATNYFYYTAFENAMTHNYLFTITAILIYLTIKWHNSPKPGIAFIMGILIGLATIVRPTEILLCLIPLLWGLYNRESVVQKMDLVISKWKHVILLITGMFIVGLLQMIYWKISSGHFLYYSYNNDIGFSFRHPHILQGLFSLRKGWLIYTPAMVLALAGIPLLWWKKRELFFPVFIFTGLIIYITYSWDVWWYGGSFGQRAMIQSYALLLIPMGVFIEMVWSMRMAKWALFIFIDLALFLNLFQTWQYLHGFWSTEGPSPYSYQLTFLKTHIEQKTIREYFQLEEPDGPTDNAVVFFKTTFKDSGWQHISHEKFFSDSSSIVIDHDAQSELLLDSLLDLANVSFLEIGANAMFEPMEYDYKKFANITVQITDSKGTLLKESKMPLQPLIGNKLITKESDQMGVAGVWDDVVMYVKAPAVDSCRIKVFLKNPGYNKIYLDNFCVLLLETGDSK